MNPHPQDLKTVLGNSATPREFLIKRPPLTKNTSHPTVAWTPRGRRKQSPASDTVLGFAQRPKHGIGFKCSTHHRYARISSWGSRSTYHSRCDDTYQNRQSKVISSLQRATPLSKQVFSGADEGHACQGTHRDRQRDLRDYDHYSEVQCYMTLKVSSAHPDHVGINIDVNSDDTDNTN
jgi:hypothetical protein